MPAPGALVLDPAQAAVLADRSPVLRVLGGPGTGKTTVVVEMAAQRVRSGALSADQVLALAPTRLAAAALRQAVTARIGGTVTEPLARTPQAFGFAVLRREAALRGLPPPRLLSGPEQDAVLRELLAGHAAAAVTAPDWPEHVREALGTRAFRGQLRDLLMRCAEHGVDAPGLAELGRTHNRLEWAAAARVLDEYDQVTALSRPGAYDPAWILTATADLLTEDPVALARLREQLRLIVVDDAQELTYAAVRLLSVLAHPGLQVVAVGDPDSAVQTFRGADPRLLWWPGWPALRDAPTRVLDTAYGMPQAVHTAAARVSQRIGALGGGVQRGSRPSRPHGRVEVALYRSAAQEGQAIAATLRRAHAHDGIPWSEQAVIVRGRARAQSLRRSLAAAGIPLAPAAADVPVRDEPVVAPLLAMFDLALRWAVDPQARVTPTEAAELLLSPIGGSDAVSLRRLRRHLRRAELDGGGRRSSDELLAELLGDPIRAQLATEGLPEGRPLRRVTQAILAGVRAAPREGSRWAAGVSAEGVLWAIWSELELAGRWRAEALGQGPAARTGSVEADRRAAARADRALDAVIGLFDAAAKFADRLPLAGPDQFLDQVRGEEVAGDTLVARSADTDTVALLTPAGAAGRRWRLVCVAGVQEGVWPDLRLRGSLLGSEHLVDVLTGRAGAGLRAAQAAVRYDETRLLHVALTRASDRVLVSAVRTEDEQPSVFLDLLDPLTDEQPTRPFTSPPTTLSLPALVGALRRDIVGPDQVARVQAARLLVTLAQDGVPGADPSSWWGLLEPPAPRPRREPDQPVPVSPSKVEQFQTCPLQWLLQASGGWGPKSPSAAIGTLVHDVVAALGDVDAASLQAEIDRRWPQLGLAPGWVSEQKRTQAHDMAWRLARYFRSPESADWERVGVELPLSVQVGRAMVSGKVDRLERHTETGALRVVDYKTGSAKTPVKDVPRHPQLGTYQAAVEAGAFAQFGERSAGAALLQVGPKAKTTGPDVQHQPALARDHEPGWANDLLARTADGMGAASFPAIPGTHCDRCPVRTSCPARPEGALG